MSFFCSSSAPKVRGAATSASRWYCCLLLLLLLSVWTLVQSQPQYTSQSVALIVDQESPALVTTTDQSVVAAYRPTVHVTSIPHSRTSKEFTTCAFTQKTRNILKLFSRYMPNIRVIHYGVEGAERFDGIEYVDVLSSEMFEEVDSQSGWREGKEIIIVPEAHINFQTFINNTVREVRARSDPRDIVVVPYGGYFRKMCADIGLANVLEPGIGYEGWFSPYRGWESYAWMHYVKGRSKETFFTEMQFDTVIPGFFDPEDFDYEGTRCLKATNSWDCLGGDGGGAPYEGLPPPGTYFLFIGRLIPAKGPELVNDLVLRHLPPSYRTVTTADGREHPVKLIVAGQGDESRFFDLSDDRIIYLGTVDFDRRNLLMAGALAGIYPTLYFEPFGYVVIETNLMGTPVITTDWGAFTETVINGYNGFRIRRMRHLVRAATAIMRGEISAADCRRRAVDNYSYRATAPRFMAWLNDIWSTNVRGGELPMTSTLHPDTTGGWYSKMAYPLPELADDPTSPVADIYRRCRWFSSEHGGDLIAPSSSEWSTDGQQYREVDCEMELGIYDRQFYGQVEPFFDEF